MKHVLFLTFILLSLCATAAPTGKSQLSDADMVRLNKAMRMMDEGAVLSSIDVLDSLAAKYPKDYYVAYESLYARYLAEKYGEVVKRGKKLFKHPEATQLIYQMVGNAYDDMGNPDEAVKIYKSGLKRFPCSGELWLEIGTLRLRQQRYQEGFEAYENGILADASFPSNYYRAAQLLFDSSELLWGLMYAETYMLLQPNNSERFAEMSQLMGQCYAKNLKIERDSVGSLKSTGVTLASNKPITVNKDATEFRVNFTTLYEACMGRALSIMAMTDKSVTTGSLGNIKALSAIRENALLNYDSCGQPFGDSMYLLAYLSKLHQAGHWEAYNYWLLSAAYPEEWHEWYENNEMKFKNFVDWYNGGNALTLDKQHTVGMTTIDRCYKAADVHTALEFISGGKLEKVSD